MNDSYEVPDWIQKAIESGGSHEEPVEVPDSEDIIFVTLLRIEEKIDQLIDSRNNESVPIPVNNQRIDISLVKGLLDSIVTDNRIEAVKYIRRMTGCSLREAVDVTTPWQWSKEG